MLNTGYKCISNLKGRNSLWSWRCAPPHNYWNALIWDGVKWKCTGAIALAPSLAGGRFLFHQPDLTPTTLTLGTHLLMMRSFSQQNVEIVSNLWAKPPYREVLMWQGTNLELPTAFEKTVSGTWISRSSEGALPGRHLLHVSDFTKYITIILTSSGTCNQMYLRAVLSLNSLRQPFSLTIE